MKILCPTDLSDEANNAVGYAAKLAQKTGSTLTLLNVQVLAELTAVEAVYGEEANVKNAEEILERQSREISILFKIDCRSSVRSSLVSLVSTIKKEAVNYDLVVMGTDGPDTFLETISGSKTYQLASESELPVLIIPDGVGFSEIKKVLFAFDYRKNKKVPMKQVLMFAQANNAEITMLQIIEEKWSRKIENELQAAQVEISDNWPHASALKFETVYADNHDKSLKHYAESLDADVVVIGDHHRNLRERIFKKSKVRDIVTGASYPLLLVH